MFKVPKQIQWKIVDKEVVNEVIFRTRNFRNRLILELMARGGLKTGEIAEVSSGCKGWRRDDRTYETICRREGRAGDPPPLAGQMMR